MLYISIFLFDNDTYMASSKNSAFAYRGPIVGTSPYFA